MGKRKNASLFKTIKKNENHSPHGRTRFTPSSTHVNRTQTVNSDCRKTDCTPFGGRHTPESLHQEIDEIAFIIHESFGKQVENDLIAIAEKLGSKGTIYYQNEALGTGHTIMCAKESIEWSDP